MKIGVLALQGGFSKHIEKIDELGCVAIPVRDSEELFSCDGLILPGGESTAISRILEENPLKKHLLEWKRPFFATCAGMILLAKWGKLKCAIARNAYGRQSDSFSAALRVHFPDGEQECEGVFIRAPKIVAILGNDVEILSSYGGEPVFVRQGNILAASFHPELTQEKKIHTLFLEVCHEYKRQNCSVNCNPK